MTLKAFTPSRASIKEGRLVFAEPDAITSALRDGCFALRIPYRFDLSPGLKLAREFYLDVESAQSDDQAATYRGFRANGDIYFDRDHFQTEHLLADQTQRKNLLPAAVNEMCEAMTGLGRIILREILSHAGVSRSLWDAVTDGAASGGGVQWLAVSHYRPERDLPGAPAHKDTGFITVLFCDQPGLEAQIDGEWLAIDPVPGHFLINFGGSLEILTRRLPDRTSAVLHGVRQCSPATGCEDRFSFATFLNPSASCDLFEVSADGQAAAAVVSVEAFLRNFNEETWKDGYADFGIQKSVVETLENGGMS